MNDGVGVQGKLTIGLHLQLILVIPDSSVCVLKNKTVNQVAEFWAQQRKTQLCPLLQPVLLSYHLHLAVCILSNLLQYCGNAISACLFYFIFHGLNCDHLLVSFDPLSTSSFSICHPLSTELDICQVTSEHGSWGRMKSASQVQDIRQQRLIH